MDLEVWCLDEAGPYPTQPYLGRGWQSNGVAATLNHEYIPNGTARMLTLFHPHSGYVRVKGVLSTTNMVLHPWLMQQFSEILSTLPSQVSQTDPEANHRIWARWYPDMENAPVSTTLPALRLLVVLDNLAGHKTPSFVRWCTQHGIALLYTPLSGSWLNMAESIQGILKGRALHGFSPTEPMQIIARLEAAACGWNRAPTPFIWGGKRTVRRIRARQRRRDQALSLSGACIRRALRKQLLPPSGNLGGGLWRSG